MLFLLIRVGIQLKNFLKDCIIVFPKNSVARGKDEAYCKFSRSKITLLINRQENFEVNMNPPVNFYTSVRLGL